ncbi:hypothetical protein FQN49_001194 [Arthroderma sp. PD_2]|nr:hypothetical protein FQN49_001194 [Arthroderma sp. PD_2]
MQLSLLIPFVFGTLAMASTASPRGMLKPVPCTTLQGQRGKCQVDQRCDGLSEMNPKCLGTNRCCYNPDDPVKRADECSAPARNTCTFYKSCLEKKIPCGPDGYAIAYGDHCCHEFTNASGQLSEKGQGWVTETMLCLQEKLVPYGTGQQAATCPDIRKFAFATHPDCYIKGGVCTLPPTDWFVIVGTVGFLELFDSVDALVATLKTVGGCIDFYIWLIKNHFIDMSKSWDVMEQLTN